MSIAVIDNQDQEKHYITYILRSNFLHLLNNHLTPADVQTQI